MDSASTRLDLSDVQRLLLRGYPGMVLRLTSQGSVIEANPAGIERLGHVLGDDTLLSPLPTDGAEAAPRDVALHPGAQHDWAFRHRDGSTQTVTLAIAALHGADGVLAVEPWPRNDDDLPLPFAHHDALTGLPTRAVLADRAEMALQRAARQKTVVAILLVEIAGFDGLCREHGASVGDDLLRAVASRLHFELRKTDTAVRLDGGLFVAMLVDLHGADEALQVASKMRTALSLPINVGVARLHVAMRIGVAWSPVHGDQLLPLMQTAEVALGGIDGVAGGVAGAPVAPVPAAQG